MDPQTRKTRPDRARGRADPPWSIAAELSRPQVFLGVAVWSGLVVLLLALSARV